MDNVERINKVVDDYTRKHVLPRVIEYILDNRPFEIKIEQYLLESGCLKAPSGQFEHWRIFKKAAPWEWR